jgi:mannose-6-phosphate isomerase
MKLGPARLSPVFSPRPWGSRSLAPYFPEMVNLPEPIGEAWMSGSDCRFATGPFAGRKLGEVWREIGTTAECGGDFPLLVKFIFPEDKLSVQVHPDDAYAARHEQDAGGRGKTEMWYVLEARPGAEVLVGLKSTITRDEFARALEDGTAEDCLNRIPLGPGDAVFVPAGTLHTIGPGLVLCEIQEFSDLTYRVYDYNRLDQQGRSRPLHIAKALDVMRFGTQYGGKITPVVIDRGRLRETYYVACRYFATEQWAFTEPVEAPVSTGRCELLIFLKGHGWILWDDERAAYRAAEVWLIPAALDGLRLLPEASTSLLRTYVPGDLGELERRLAERGLSEAEWLSLVHR